MTCPVCTLCNEGRCRCPQACEEPEVEDFGLVRGLGWALAWAALVGCVVLVAVTL